MPARGQGRLPWTAAAARLHVNGPGAGSRRDRRWMYQFRRHPVTGCRPATDLRPSGADRIGPTDRPRLRLVPAVCALCGVDDADPVGVGQDFEYRTSPDHFLAVRCRRCGLVFLNPRPADEEAGRIYPTTTTRSTSRRPGTGWSTGSGAGSKRDGCSAVRRTAGRRADHGRRVRGRISPAVAP